MATDETASIHQLHQPRPKTAAERAKAYRERKRVAGNPASTASLLPVAQKEPSNINGVEISAANNLARLAGNPAVAPPTVTFGPVRERDAAPILLILAAFALAVVGMTMNGWFARSLGSSDVAGWLFLTIGVCADLVALVMPSVASRAWHGGRRATASAGWLVWLMTFVFAITAGIGFASLNIADVTMARSERVTPAVTNAQTAVSDAMTARDRECIHGVGKFCREREATVVDARKALDQAMMVSTVVADPQSQAAIRMVAWASRGALAPTEADFAMLRLALLALLPQIGGVLLLVGRR